MARLLSMRALGMAANHGHHHQAGVLQHEGSGIIFIVGMIVMSVAILSLVVFGCADGARRRRKRHGGFVGGYYGGGGGGGACGGGGGGGGCGGGGGGGGGCGGGGGGGGC
ncbi:OLC1v1023468C1 [Oldenlandia corymbosa var. corymbosa]|uniref:OLC1v1023468C1 n=1 Tax=Oldenlandia corymbosa var. corymbosa TaxID=529605 RepID=A0AAV1C001_OLDCO|nr:OLC1v1023468C1 [Oldenlandia corymbosa var. corymbosa]